MPKIKKELEVVNVDDEDNYNSIREQISNTNNAVIDTNADDKPSDDNKAEDKPSGDDNKAEDDNISYKATQKKTLCPDCGKLLSMKTLKYTHKYQCTHNNRKKEELHQPPPKPQLLNKNEAPSYIRKPPVKRYDHINLF